MGRQQLCNRGLCNAALYNAVIHVSMVPPLGMALSLE
jgi:hypothetical protein